MPHRRDYPGIEISEKGQEEREAHNAKIGRYNPK